MVRGVGDLGVPKLEYSHDASAVGVWVFEDLDADREPFRSSRARWHLESSELDFVMRSN